MSGVRDTSPAVDPERPGELAAVGLGSNLGDRLRHLVEGRAAVREQLSGARCSRVYATEPVGVRGQPDFLNLCCVGRTAASASQLLDAFLAAERRAGREPEDREGPRPLDLDLLLYGDRRISEPELEVPHPRMTERAFVLVPLAELIPDVVVPDTGRTVQRLARELSHEGVEPLGRLDELVGNDEA